MSSTTAEADLFLVLRLFDPDGEEVTFQGAIDPHTPISQGWLRVSQRELDPERSTRERPYHTHARSEPLVPGEIHEVEVEVWPTCVVAPAGYRLALTVRGKDYVYDGEPGHLAQFVNPLTGCGPFLHDDPRDRPAPTYAGTTTIHCGGETASSVLIPFVPARRS